jgi:hypothetical protein
LRVELTLLMAAHLCSCAKASNQMFHVSSVSEDLLCLLATAATAPALLLTFCPIFLCQL